MSYVVAVIGCGVIGKRLGQAFQDHPETNLKYAVDRNSEVLEEYCEQFSTLGFTDYLKLPFDEIDIVYVGVPPKYHDSITIDALKRGKHVICEKPIAVNSDIGSTMVEAANNSDVVTAINFPFNYMSTFDTLEKYVEENKIGQVNKIEIRIHMPQWPRSWQNVEWLKDHDQGGPLREIGSHFIFGVMKLFGDIAIDQKLVELTEPDKFEELIQVTFKTAEGIRGTIELSTLDTKYEEQNDLYLEGETEKIRFRDWYILEKYEEGSWKIVDDTRSSTVNVLIDRFISSIRGEDANLVSFDMANKVQQVIDVIFDE